MLGLTPTRFVHTPEQVIAFQATELQAAPQRHYRTFRILASFFRAFRERIIAAVGFCDARTAFEEHLCSAPANGKDPLSRPAKSR